MRKGLWAAMVLVSVMLVSEPARAQQFPPFEAAIVCPILEQARAQLIATTDALVAQFSFLAPQIEAVKAQALATIDAQ